MATPDIERLRALTDGAVGFTDSQLQTAINTEGGVKQAGIHIWRTKAATYSNLVDVSESGSSRSLSKLQTQALTMAETLARDLASEAEIIGSAKTTRRIVRR